MLLASCRTIAPKTDYQPRLTRAQAVRIASTVPYPAGYSRDKYAYKGTAIFFPPMRQWGVGYEWTGSQPTAIGADLFIVWIDDASGKFSHYGYGR